MFTVAKMRKQLKCESPDELIKQMGLYGLYRERERNIIQP